MPISNFFEQFNSILYEENGLYQAAEAETLGDHDPRMPELWKINGDELLYTVEIGLGIQVVGAVMCFLRAVRKYRAEQEKNPTNMDVKATIWGAGFPILNSEVAVRTKAPTDEDLSDHSRLTNYELLEKWHLGQRKDIVRDFLGPSIDTGFRLTALATPRKMVLSLEVAYILAHVISGKPEFDEQLSLHYDKSVPLRGVLNGKPYPVFWLDTMLDDKLIKSEDGITGRQPLVAEQIVKFTGQFFDRNDRYLFRPFILNEKIEALSIKPAHYDEHLARLKKIRELEIERLSLEKESQVSTDVPDLNQEDATSDEVLESVRELVRFIQKTSEAHSGKIDDPVKKKDPE